MFLVVIRWFSNTPDTMCIVTATEEKAQEWIDKEMQGVRYNGTGIHKIIPVELYK